MSHIEKLEAVVKWGAVALYIGGRQWAGCDDITKEEERELLAEVRALSFEGEIC